MDNNDGVTVRQFVGKLCQQDPGTIRSVCGESFVVAANVLTYW
jgi:hypothetical protein